MIDATSKSTKCLVIGAIAASAICSGAMNFRFGFHLGSTYSESLILGSFSVALDIIKVTALPFAAIAWTKRYRVKSLTLGLLWMAAVIYAVTAATGFAYTARSAGATERQMKIEEHGRNKDEYDRLVAEVAIARSDAAFASTSGCTNITLPTSEQFCALFAYKTGRMEELRDDLADGSGGDADPQAALFASLTGLDVKTVGQWLAISVAVIAELVSAFGSYAFSRTVREPVRASREARSRPKLQVVNS